jgi:hypothetical protein
MGLGSSGKAGSRILVELLNLQNQNDGRWASFVNGFTISGEIQAFKEKLTEAREFLSVSWHL